MTTRRAFIGTLAGGLLAAPLAAGAQQGGKVWRIGIVLPGGLDTVGHIAKAIEGSLANAGYAHGKNVTLEWRFYPPNPAGAEEVFRAIVPTIDPLIV
jgi:hypothetical protein